MKKALVLMGLVLAAALIVPSAVPAKQADIPVSPSYDIPVGPTAYMARGVSSNSSVSPSLTDIPVAPAQVAYMARGLAGDERGLGQGLLLDNFGREKKAIIVIG